MKVGLRHPDTQRRVLLPERLTGGDRTDSRHRLRRCRGIDEHVLVVPSFGRSRQVIPDQFAQTELNQTREERANQ